LRNKIFHIGLGGLREGIHLFLSECLGRSVLRLSIYKTRVNFPPPCNMTWTNHVTQTGFVGCVFQACAEEEQDGGMDVPLHNKKKKNLAPVH